MTIVAIFKDNFRKTLLGYVENKSSDHIYFKYYYLFGTEGSL